MKKQFTNRILSLVLALMIVVGLVPMNVLTASAADKTACESTSGCTGTYDNGFCTVCDGYQVPSQNANGYYEISNAGNLYWFTYKVETNLKANAILTADIDLNPGYEFASDGTVTKDGVTVTEGWRHWEPIGVYGFQAGYQGIFDGNFHTVRGMYCIAEGGASDSFLGLFSRITGGTVTELGVTNGYVFGLADIGGIVGYVDSGTISKCWSEVTVMSSSDVYGTNFGGIAGSNAGVIDNCYNLGLVSGRGLNLGGIVGSQNTVQFVTKVNNCYNMGAVVPKGTETGYGIIVGAGGERVFNCYYLSESETDGLSGTTAATTTDFSSGKVTYLLNQGITDGSQAWYQTCGQGIPTFTGKTVYAISNSCYIGDGISGYTNQATVVPVHNYNSNGFCKNMRADGITVCDDYQPCEKDANGSYEIGNAGQLYWFARQVNEKEELSANAVLTADITINADINAADRRNWTPIGDYELTGKKYSGTFDGRVYKIRGLYCNRGSSSCAGLFGKCDRAVLKNINVEASYFYADQLAAAIAGDVAGSQVINCHSINNTIIISSYTAGGVLGGCTDSIVDRCSNTSKVTHLDNGVIDDGFRSGGIIGWAENVTITNCWNSGEISARRLAAGGIVGGKTNDLSVKNCYNVGTVTLIGDAVNSGAYSPILGMEYNQDAPGELNIVNCYYLKAIYPESQRREGTTEKSADNFKSGEVTYLLNGSKSEGELVWYQTLGVDAYPQFDGTIVYYDDTYGYNNGHFHKWKYELYGEDTITAACMEDGCPITDGGYVTITAESKAYTGTAITDAAKVDYSDNWVGSKDLDISYADNINVGEATASFTVGEGDAKVTASTTFKINAADISDATVKVNPESDVYNGEKQKPDLSVEWNGITLTKDTDYVLSWDSSDLTNAGTHTATITGKGNFTGTKNAVFSITPADIKGAVVTIDQNTFDYDGQPHKPTAIVTFNGAVLTEGVDYELYYISKDQIIKWNNDRPVKFFGNTSSDCINAGQYYVCVRGKGNFVTNSGFAYAPYTIKQAKNNWVTEPWITDWTYGKSANVPVGEAKFGTVYVIYDGTANDGTTYNGDTPPTKAGSYVARFFVDETANYEPIAYSVPFTVKKANYNMNGAKWNYREPFQYNGKEHKVEVVGLPAGVTVKNYENNTAVAVGDYYAEVSFAYDADNYNAPVINKLGWTIYNDWTPTEYTVNGSGWMNKDFVISANDGYKVSLTNTADGTWSESLTYSAETSDGSVTFYLRNETDGTISLAKTVSYNIDKTDPTGRVEFDERNGWEKFINTITFGLFFRNEVTVKIAANDALSGVDKIEYVSFDEAKTLDEVKAITDWTEYNGSFGVTLEDAKRFVYFVRITDKAGNVTYLSTDGAEYDTTAPVLYGIENGGVYHGDKVFKAMDKNFLKIEVDGVDITDTTEGDDEFKIVADNAEHTVTVTDKAENVTEFKITVYKKYMVTYSNGDGGSYEKEFKYGEVITIPTNEFFKDTFRKTGHTIKEWQGYTEGMTMPLSNLTFTAVYTPCEYIVAFDQNGGAEISPITVTFGEKYGSLPSSAITGLSGGNKNWYLVDADGNVTDTNIKNLTIVSTARDHKLFIKRNVLAPSVSVVLTVPGGISDGYQYYIPGASTRVLTATVGNMNTDILEYTYQWYKDGTLIEGANSNVLTLDGNVSDSGTYKVEVTAKLKDGTNIVVNSNTATASKEQKVKILHATNTLSYDANGGEGGPQSSYTGGTSINVSKETPTKEHNNFIGWNTAPDGTGESYQAEDAYIFVNDNGNGGCVVTLYARWKLVEYTITYVADGESVATEKVEHGKDATLTDVPHKDGYVGKWNSDGKNITEDTTISAVYTEVPVVNPDEVKPEDKTDLEDTKAKLEEMLKDDSYTDDDKKDIQDAIDDIDDALKVIGNVEAAIELIDKLPAVDTVKPDDEEAIKAIADAQTAYNALSDYEKSLLDEAAKANLDKLVAALVAYDIVEGDGSSWTEDSDHNITFVVNGLFSKFVGIKVDGKDVDKANYEVKAGSTIITLKASYLDTLAVGEHTITVVYTDGSTDGTFNVHAKANSPATGDNSNMFLWIALLFISGGAVITLTVVDKKKKSLIKK